MNSFHPLALAAAAACALSACGGSGDDGDKAPVNAAPAGVFGIQTRSYDGASDAQAWYRLACVVKSIRFLPTVLTCTAPRCTVMPAFAGISMAGSDTATPSIKPSLSSSAAAIAAPPPLDTLEAITSANVPDIATVPTPGNAIHYSTATVVIPD